MFLRNHIQFLVQHIANQTETPFAIVVIHIPEDLVFIEPFGEELTDDEIDFRTVGVIGEATRIGHHTTVDRNGYLARHLLKATQLPYHPEQQFTGTAHLWMRNA